MENICKKPALTLFLMFTSQYTPTINQENPQKKQQNRPTIEKQKHKLPPTAQK
jgi:hypothetical protein